MKRKLVIQNGDAANIILAAIILVTSSPVFAQAESTVNITPCLSINDNTARLACYDTAARRPSPDGNVQLSQPPVDVVPEKAKSVAVIESNRSAVSMLSKRWELDDADKTGVFAIRPYEPIYLMPVHYTSSINDRPTSPAPNHNSVVPREYAKAEIKYELSFKTKLAERVLFDRSDLWFGYTQRSLWQIYNKKQSSPFRETNYRPEVMLVTPTHYRFLGLEGRMLNVGFKHESNGQSDPRSRSWNRIYAQAGFERDNFVLILEPWWRLPESSSGDDNPDISDYIGRGKIFASYLHNGHQWALQVQNNFRRENNRGSVQLNWSYPLFAGLKGYVELFSGYGESMIDYNHRQNTLGLGVSLVDWF